MDPELHPLQQDLELQPIATILPPSFGAGSAHRCDVHVHDGVLTGGNGRQNVTSRFTFEEAAWNSNFRQLTRTLDVCPHPSSNI